MPHLLEEADLSKGTGQAALKVVVARIEEDQRWEEASNPSDISRWEVSAAQVNMPSCAEGFTLPESTVQD